MRLLQFTAIAIGLLSVRSASVQAQDYWFNGGYYPVQVIYYRPCVAEYASSPTYSSSYYAPQGPYESAPVYSYYAPLGTYNASTCCQPTSTYSQPAPTPSRQPQTYERSDASEYSSRRAGTTIGVEAHDNYFQPRTINIQPGTTVRWVNRGRHNHTVTSNDKRWDSGDIKPGAAYSATFKHPGTYYYYCLHHTGDKMQGAIVVGSGETTHGESRATGY